MASRRQSKRPRPAKAALPVDLPPDGGAQIHPVDLPPAMFTGPGLMALADLLPVMTAYVDRALTYRFMNKALAEWLGQPRRAMIGKTMAEVLGDENFEPRKAMVEAALSGERQFFAATFEHPARGLVAAQTDYVPWVNPGSGEIEGVVIVVADITEQRVTERALRESEARFRRIANSAPAMMWVTRRDRVRDFVNDTYANFVAGPDADREAVRTVDWRTRIHPDDVERIVAESLAGEASARPFTLEGRYQRHDGEYRWLRSVSQPRFGPDGELVGFIGVASDITLAKEAELELKALVAAQTEELLAAQEQLRQSQKMEALGQLTGGIAHDFNNLLTVVVGGLDLIAKRTEDDKLRKYAENALAAAERGARLTGQLLAFSRVQRLEVRPTQVAPLIHAMRPLLRNVLGPGIEKRFDLDTAVMPVMADPTQLEVAVLNLAINARDAMPDGGVLSFSSRPVTIGNDPEIMDGDYVELTITDTGSGMADDVLARAFEPFFTTKEVGKGTGLGLSMVYGMARQSGGGARIYSRPGEGTKVKLYFRVTEAAAAQAAAAPRKEARRKRAHASVLVIDDDPDVRGFIAATLTEQGYKVREASGGRQGLAEIARAAPDLVVLDFVMPGLSGAEVAARIREARPDQPILFVSGYSETDAVKRIAPDAPLLAKPFRADALERAVRDALAASNAD
jgi:PAS domain S-box-containing protein